MDKMTFKKFLIEFDRADLELGRQKRENIAANAARTQTKDEFKKNQEGSSPSPGDIVQTGDGKFFVDKMSMDGIHLKNGATLPHGTKFKNMGRSPGGKFIFAVV